MYNQKVSKLTKLSPYFQIFPCCATMKAVAVEFKDLWKIRHPVGNCEGFNLNTFDSLIDVGTFYVFFIPQTDI